ncbi:pilus assembly protein TadG-related protein [Sphingopyxis solisilvae]|uniref:pilus assembly protein TadG-related protein n=1 Tax=Sphingopyxis solisilvae TaxID=1886788 RepID=UPI001892D265|nr:pilus assembly protein TadG-related protein [Sphingopyxis solisilvae]
MRSGSDCRRLTPTAKRMIFDTRGATAAIFAISLPILVGMGALAVDVGLWNVQKRHAQGAADQAAFSAAVAAKAGNSAANVQINARAITAGMGFVHAANGVTVAVTNPPSAGQFAGQTGYWEVTITEPQSTWLAGLLFSGDATVRARAVAGGAAGGNACIIGLATTGTSISMSNGNEVTNPGCAVYSNANMSMSNNSKIFGSAYVSGTISMSNGATIGTQQTGVTPVADPYADVTVPSSCPGTAKMSANNNQTINYTAGNYCDGIQVGNGVTINLAPGTYYIGKTITNGNNLTINATGGVTLVLMNGAAFNDANGITLNITAPSTGTYAGVALMSLATSPTSQTFMNNMTFNVQGAMYFRNQNIEFKNNMTFNAALCTQLVAQRIIMKNNANMNNTCPGTGIRNPGNSSVALME